MQWEAETESAESLHTAWLARKDPTHGPKPRWLQLRYYWTANTSTDPSWQSAYQYAVIDFLPARADIVPALLGDRPGAVRFHPEARAVWQGSFDDNKEWVREPTGLERGFASTWPVQAAPVDALADQIVRRHDREEVTRTQLLNRLRSVPMPVLRGDLVRLEVAGAVERRLEATATRPLSAGG